jgi:hypothetical protein
MTLFESKMDGNDVVVVSAPFSMKIWFRKLRTSESFRNEWNDLLRSLPFEEYRFKSSRVSMDSIPAVFVFKKARLNHRNVDTYTFKDYWPANENILTVVFESKTGKSIMVVPTPYHCNESKHLADFVRYNTYDHIQDFWKTVGEIPNLLFPEKSKRTFFIETDGSDVAWLHLKFRI